MEAEEEEEVVEEGKVVDMVGAVAGAFIPR
jgi:hypothetical protein